jgi:hypothetical protein
MIRLTNDLTLGAVLQDIGSQYKWDTSSIYGEQGASTIERFPVLRKIGLSYAFDEHAGLISLELENSNMNTKIIRLGAEAALSDQFTIRGGLDHWDPQDPGQSAPTFGFTLRVSSSDFIPILNYAYVVEPYGLFAMNIISLSSRF